MKTKRKILAISGVLIMLIIGTVVLNPKIAFALSPWKTQEIIYRHLTDSNCRIEYQLQGMGALGYNSRIVKVETVLFLDFAEEIDTSRIDKSDWQRVDEYINELELKGG
jgi:hypothetical protein